MKKCNRCGENKKLNKFYKDKTKKDKLSTLCKLCKDKGSKEYAANNKMDIAYYQKEYQQKNKEHLTEYKEKYYHNSKDARIIYLERNKNKIKTKAKEYYAHNKTRIALRRENYTSSMGYGVYKATFPSGSYIGSGKIKSRKQRHSTGTSAIALSLKEKALSFKVLAKVDKDNCLELEALTIETIGLENLLNTHIPRGSKHGSKHNSN